MFFVGASIGREKRKKPIGKITTPELRKILENWESPKEDKNQKLAGGGGVLTPIRDQSLPTHA